MKLNISSPCKVNITLRVMSPGPDGFHDICSVFMKLPSMERLTITPAKSNKVNDKIVTHNCRIYGRNILEPVIEKLHLFDSELPALEIDLWKAIPPGTGLGGGSGNAAALLRWFSSFTEIKDYLTDGSEFGSDIPFLFRNTNIALVTGRGERVEALDVDISNLKPVIFIPKWRVSTSWAYSQLDRSRSVNKGHQREDLEDLKRESFHIAEILAEGRYYGLLPNDFIPVILKAHPSYEDLFDCISKTGALAWGISGSGSSAFALFDRNDTGMFKYKHFDKMDWIDQIIIQG